MCCVTVCRAVLSAFAARGRRPHTSKSKRCDDAKGMRNLSKKIVGDYVRFSQITRICIAGSLELQPARIGLGVMFAQSNRAPRRTAFGAPHMSRSAKPRGRRHAGRFRRHPALRKRNKCQSDRSTDIQHGPLHPQQSLAALERGVHIRSRSPSKQAHRARSRREHAGDGAAQHQAQRHRALPEARQPPIRALRVTLDVLLRTVATGCIGGEYSRWVREHQRQQFGTARSSQPQGTRARASKQNVRRSKGPAGVHSPHCSMQTLGR